MKIYQFKKDVSKEKPQIVEWMNDITIGGKTHPKFQGRSLTYNSHLCVQYLETT